MYIRGLMVKLPQETVFEHINVFLKTPNSIYLGHVASAAVLVYIALQNPSVPRWFVIGWGLLQLIGYPLLMELWRKGYERKRSVRPDPYLWIRLMDILCLAVGISWGVMAFLSLNPAHASHFAIQLSIAAGATSAAVRSLASFPRSYFFYSVPFLGLLAARLFLLGEDFVLLAGLVLVFLVMMLRMGSDVLESVGHYIEISNENLDLAQRYREAADEAEYANRAKTRLLAAASHDLRQPIHAIGLYMESLPLQAMDRRSRETLLRIRSSLQTLSKLFNSLLDVSLLDSGKIPVRPSLFDLQDMLNHVLDDYEPLAEIAHVTLMLECSRIGVNGDAILIRRMVQNLLSNAIRYSNEGSVRLRVTSGEGLGEGEIAISVSDDGPGIAEEHKAIIFEEFTQIAQRPAHLSASSGQQDGVTKGLGLGLAIVRRLADLQSYSLDLQSGLGGTTITISGLKAAPLTESRAISSEVTDRLGARISEKRILIVDDDEETLQATQNLLQKWGYQVQAATGLEPLKRLKGPFDLVISDFSFGTGYTGIDIIREARHQFGDAMRALVISGDSSDYVQKSVEMAGHLLIHKPVQPVQLRSAMLDVFLTQSAGEQVLS